MRAALHIVHRPVCLPCSTPLQAKGGQVDLLLHDDRALLALQGPKAAQVLQVRGVGWGWAGRRVGSRQR